MTQADYSRRDFVQHTMLLGGGLLVASCTSGGGGSGSGGGSGRLPAVEGGTVVTDPAAFPKKFAESPEFARAVAAGRLPPVAERIGRDPLVIKPVHQIGKYGGELRRGYVTPGDDQNGHRFCAGPDNLLYWDYTLQKVIPNIARDYELNEKNTVMTLHLRRGMKWSDGKPLTADDIIFWWEDINNNKTLSGGTSALRVGGKAVRIVKVDDFTVEYVFPVPYPIFPRMLASMIDIGGMTQWGKTGGGGFAPKHYLSQFHPKYTSEAAATKAAKAAGFESWSAFFLQQGNNWAKNTELPTLTPWILERPINNTPWELTANPYSIWVDTAGNQLPYIPKITMGDAGSTEVLSLRAVAGEYDFQDRNLTLASLPVLLKNQRRSKYTIRRAPSTEMDFTLRVNLAYVKDKVLGELLTNVDFRRALSLGIDRNQFNQTFFAGTAIPSATMVANDSPYFPGAAWRTKWATHDPAQANRLLDKIGLTKKDSAGYRIRPDGKGRIRLEYAANASLANYPAMGEMLKRQWKSIGIDMIVETLQVNLMIERILANEVILQGIAGGTEDPFVRPDTFLPNGGISGVIGIPYAKWFASQGKAGVEPPKSLNSLKEAMRLYERGLRATDSERIELGKQLYMLHADQVFSIGVLGFGLTVYGLYYAKNNLGNVPARIINSTMGKAPSNLLPMTFFYK